MRPPQPVLSPITEAAIFLVLTVEDGAETDLRCWDRLFGSPRPAGLHALPVIAGARHAAVSTPGDLLFHIRAHRFDLCFELAQRLAERLDGAARVVDEVHGFRSFDERDLLGFVDGTENPAGVAAVEAALVGEEDPSFAGGSYVIVQKYVHDIADWEAQPVEQQERVIGRTKLSDVELPDEIKPADSHVALNTIVGEDGEERKILRYNMPFGRVGADEFGTYFIGYARTPDVTELMLSHMFLGDPPGSYDRILDFSTALTGTLFFAPSADMLDDPPGPPGDERAAVADGDGSLRIGALKGDMP